MTRVKPVSAPFEMDVRSITYHTAWDGPITWSVVATKPVDAYWDGPVLSPNPTLAPAVRAAFDHLSEFIPLQVTEGEGAAATIRIAQIPPTGNLAGFAFFPSPYPEAGDIYLTNQTVREVAERDFGWHVLLHEIGHALGLVHPHEDDAYGTLPAHLDSVELTLMSYRSYPNGSIYEGLDYEPFGYASTYMTVDIAALQHIYGANYGHNNGNTRYAFDATERTILKTIWDGGGIDTYTFLNYRNDLHIDLAPGGKSVTGQEPQVNRLGETLDGDAPIFASASIHNARLYQGDWRSAIENAIGGYGNDTIDGNRLANNLSGRNGHDQLVGHEGNDSLIGGAGNDRLFGGHGRDRLLGQGDNDRLSGGDGGDHLDGGDGSDRILGEGGNDLLIGRSGRDTLLGGLWRDDLHGGAGDDLLAGEHAADTLRGHDGSDRLFGGDGSDVLMGDRGHDRLHGGRANDRLLGGDHTDHLFGEDGRDTLFGDSGHDLLDGGLHADLLSGGAGFDTLRGGDGHDRLDGGAHNDTLSGGAGRDTFVALGAGSGYDVITDFSVREDKIDVPDRAWAVNNLLDRGDNTLIHDGVNAVLLLNIETTALSLDNFV